MSGEIDDLPVDPELDALLHRTLGRGSLGRERRRRHLLQLGIPVPESERLTSASTLSAPTGRSYSVAYSTSEKSPRTLRQWMEVTAVAAVLILILAAVVSHVRGDAPASTQFAATSVRPSPAAPQVAGSCDATPWTMRDAVPALTAYRWIGGSGLSLGSVDGRLVAGENAVLWLASFPYPGELPVDDARVGLTGTRIGSVGNAISLEQRNQRLDNSTQLAHNILGVRSTVIFPTDGCWRIDANIGTMRLHAVVVVEPVE